MKFSEMKIGQVYRSKTHPRTDLSIAYIADDMGDGYKICWVCANEEAFMTFCMEKLGRNTDTFPYAFAGECGIKAFNARLNKYDLKLEMD